MDGCFQDAADELWKLGCRKVRKKGKKKSHAARKREKISEIFQDGNTEKITFNQMLEWIEEKTALLNSLSTSSGEATEDIKILIEEILEGVEKAKRSAFIKSEGLRDVIRQLKETALRLLEIYKTAPNCHGINDINTLTSHLSVIAGTNVTAEEVLKYVNSNRVLNLYEVSKNRRSPVLKKIKTIKKKIEDGLEELQIASEVKKIHVDSIKDIFSKDAASSDSKEMNLKLKAAASEIEVCLYNYEGPVGYLMTNVKNFFNAKNDNERLISNFMTLQIESLFKAVVLG